MTSSHNPDVRPTDRNCCRDSSVQGDIRTVISAETAYQSESRGNGYPAAISCLHTPSSPECIPGYPATAPTFLDSNLAQATLKKYGFVRTYTVTARAVGTGRDGFCYNASPIRVKRVEPGDGPYAPGTRSFGGDASGVLGGTQAYFDCCKHGRLDQTACPPLN